MEICSPKDGFVVEVVVKDGQNVEINDVLLSIDGDDEARDQARHAKMENVRMQMAAQYSGPEFQVSKRLAQIAVDLAKELEVWAATNLEHWKTQESQRIGTHYDVQYASSGLNQATLSRKKAELELEKFNYSVDRHVKINEIVKTYMQFEGQILDTKRKRLKVLAPQGGQVHLRVAVNSFAELGSVLLEIK